MTAPKTRPRIGVALEGGGALGLAHIGVLQWFEEHHIPVDYIAGTSMGGLVAGLYATGKTPKELQAIVEAQSWDIIIGGTIPFEDLSFRRKEDLVAYPNSLELGLKHGLSLPLGLNTGHVITLLIDRETLPYSGVNTFDDLPIPFRCVATDLVSGKEVVFSQGDLAEALRATMSIPAIFSPVHDGDKVYVDGGLVGNLPTDVVRAMGADIVIGVHLEVATAKASDIQSLVSVLGRSIDVVIRDNEIRGLAGADLIVRVDMHDFSSMDYEKSKAIINRGVDATAAKANVLTPYFLTDSEWHEYLEKRDARKHTSVPVPQFVKVEGVDPVTEKSIERFLRPLVGKPVDSNSLDRLLTRLAGIGKFSRLGYRMSQSNGQDGLIVTVHEKDYAPPILQLAFEVDGSEIADVTFTQAGRVTLMDVAGYRSEWRNDFLLGNTYAYQTELYKPFNAVSKWFVAPHAGISDAAFRIYDKNNPRADYRLRSANAGVDFGYGFSRFTEVRFGYEWAYLSARLRLGAPEFESVNGNASNGRIRFLTDHGDDPVIPRRGYRVETNFRFFNDYPNAVETIPALDARLGYFQPISQPSSLFLIGEGGTTLGKAGGIPLYFLGGPSRLSAYGLNELFGNQYYAFRAGYLRNIFTLPPFVGKQVYALGTYEFGKMYGVPTESKFPNDVAFGIIAETAVGPILLGGSLGDSGHRKWFFQLGRVF
ncbi:MAG TPA: patatin-like phospholipase family protein [Terriglobales bacterium]|jgi:NTE family protein|nr:patatin-like phospholipase family protein [Terriglobales bacterium]